MRWLKWLRNSLYYLNDHFEEIMSVILFTLMTFFIFIQVIFRQLVDAPLDWTEELGRYTFIWLVFFSASLAVKEGRHLRIEFIETLLKKKMAKWYSLFAQFVWLLFSLFMVKAGYGVASLILGSGSVSPSVGITVGYLYMIVPIGFALMSFRIIQAMIKKYRTE